MENINLDSLNDDELKTLKNEIINKLKTKNNDRTYYYKNKELSKENLIFCKYCKIIKPMEEFNIILIKNKEYRRKRCKKCYNTYAREYRNKNKNQN
jgi:hypothetical protein